MHFGLEEYPCSPGVPIMSLTAIRGRRTGLALLLLVCLAFAPGAAADDYFFLFPDGQGEEKSGCPFPPALESPGGVAGDGSDSGHFCSCLLCAMTIGSGISTSIFHLNPTEKVRHLSFVRFRTYWFSEIFHPPRA